MTDERHVAHGKTVARDKQSQGQPVVEHASGAGPGTDSEG
jgi:hypothetical protein